MAAKPSLVCVGDLTMDVLITESRLADGMPGGISLRAGGSAANVAAWAAVKGCRASWMGAVGGDAPGRFLVDDLRAHGVAPHAAILDAYETGVVLSWIGRRGNRTMHSARWAAAAVDVESMPLSALSGATAVHVTGYGTDTRHGFDLVATIFAQAARRGDLLSFDPSDAATIRRVGAPRLLDLCQASGVGVIFANRREATELTGESRPNQAARVLQHSVKVSVVKDGGHGCVIACDDGIRRIPAVRVEVVDTTGAGDAFAGAWLASYLEQADAKTACECATEAAGEVIGKIGARPGFE